MTARRILLPVLLGTVIASGHGYASSFEKRVLRSKHPIVQDALPVRLGESPHRHLVVVSSPDAVRTFVDLYAPDETGAPSPTSTRIALPAEVLALDTAPVDGDTRDVLYFLTSRALLRWDERAGRVVEERSVRSIYRRRVPGRLLTPDFMRAGDDSGPRLVVADFDGVHVGTTLLPVPPRVTHHHEHGTTYQARSPHFADLDLDGRADVFFIVDDSLHLFAGVPGGFSQAPAVRQLGLGLQETPTPVELSQLDLSDLTVTRVAAVEDFDGDDLVDLLVETAHQAGVFDRTTRYRLHRGRRGPDGVTFATDADTEIVCDGTVGRVTPVDIDADGRRDLMATCVDFGLGKLMSTLLTGSFEIDLLFFRLSPEGTYARKADTKRQVRIAFSLVQGRPSIPVVQLADVDGDGLRDLVLGEDGERILVHTADGGPKLFARKADRTPVELPDDGDFVTTHDVDGDGRQDVLIRYGMLDGAATHRRLTVLLAR